MGRQLCATVVPRFCSSKPNLSDNYSCFADVLSAVHCNALEQGRYHDVLDEALLWLPPSFVIIVIFDPVILHE